MTSEERARITSIDYADLIIEYNENQALLEGFVDATINYINFRYAIVHVPVSQITRYTIPELGFGVIPTCFGLLSAASLEATGVFNLRSLPRFDLRGQGVLLGILDTGIDYTNPIFQYEDNTTRIFSIWDQTIDSEDRYPPNLYYGTEYTRDEINMALDSENPYDIVPSRDENGHGTMMAGIAGGRDVPEEGFYGIASDAEFVIVKLKEAKPYLRDFFHIPKDANCYQTNDIMLGVKYILQVARTLDRPVAICIGLGSSITSHDGLGPLSQYLAEIADIPGTAVITAVGNEGNGKRHYFGVVDATIGYDTVELNVAENEPGFSMILWGNRPSIYSIDILSPGGEYVPRIPPRINENQDVSFIFETTIINVDFQIIQTPAGDQMILLRFQNPSPGIWRFRVFDVNEAAAGFHIWLPMEHFISPNTFFIRSDPYTTVLDPANTFSIVSVTAYNPVDDSLYLNAGRGYNRRGQVTPKVAAPGVNIISPTLRQEFAPVTGTSAAAAHTAGIAAMMLEWGIVRGNYPGFDTAEVRNYMIRSARRNPDTVYPNPDWGYGILDVFNVFDILRSSIGNLR
ncbi:MAG: S8 family peptidase [Clostridiales bacterium]|jgi:subtilisin family serine protease|nr:S8 family peptidase [Clostridiales bacterium]